MVRVAAYVDGFNLYFGMRSRGMRRYYWLDPGMLAAALAPGKSQKAIWESTLRTCQLPDEIAKPGFLLVRPPTWS